MAATTVRDRTRREIVQQAMALFQSNGYTATSLQDIATATGCSKATVLYHFNGKAAVLAAVLEPSHAGLVKLLAEVSPLPAAEAQRIAIKRFVELAVEFRGVISVLQDVLPTMDEMPEFTDLISRGIQLTVIMAGGPDDQLELGLTKFAVNGLLAECRHSGERTDAELQALCDTALQRLLRLPS
ncbi:TetR/AcrR family transcriptional regulator [Streptomyces sp. SID13031]|uniref:TetR/AcrR family transcriptional regulator n=1 Tax=Streptomyces sp. SID13031 TaxID=2706046 RepID=UPI0013C5BB2B|nr:TetR/AcrR family transcriptional regulator [Streptomyces sp. SID13031]NEA31601.1 TetR/AcrR family transcriptional regulator [Streptomyces sp. SID13031]